VLVGPAPLFHRQWTVKFASLKSRRDGALILVSRDLTRAVAAGFVAPTLQSAIEDWDAVAALLDQAPELEAKTLFEWLCEQQPGQYQEGQLRTLQRRVSTWRALNQSALLTLEQVHQPGEVLQTDGTGMNELGITLGGQAFPHLLLHSVLPYSNWEWGRVVQSESLLAIRLAVQSALVQLGHVPKIHQTDNTTAATHNLSPATREQSLEARGFNEEYLQLMAHFGLEPRTIHLASPNENGDIEAANGAFKRAVAQHLLLRGSRDFEHLAAYETFLWQIMEKRNAMRRTRLAEELAVMRPLTVNPWPPMRELRPKVNRAGIIRVCNNGYSVPSGLPRPGAGWLERLGLSNCGGLSRFGNRGPGRHDQAQAGRTRTRSLTPGDPATTPNLRMTPAT